MSLVELLFLDTVWGARTMVCKDNFEFIYILSRLKSKLIEEFTVVWSKFWDSFNLIHHILSRRLRCYRNSQNFLRNHRKGILNKKLQEEISLSLFRCRLRNNIKRYFQDIVRMTVKLNDLPQHRRRYWDIVDIRMELYFKGTFSVQSNTFLNYWNGWNSHFVFFAIYYLIQFTFTVPCIVNVFL